MKQKINKFIEPLNEATKQITKQALGFTVADKANFYNRLYSRLMVILCDANNNVEEEKLNDTETA